MKRERTIEEKEARLAELKLKVAELNPLIEVMNEEYKGTRSMIICRCKIHDTLREVNIWKLLINAECPECKSDRRIHEIKESVSVLNPNIEILSDVYISAQTKMPCFCKVCEHEWSANSHNLQQGKGCPKCKHHLKLTISEVKARLFIINPDIEILSEVFVTTKDKLDCKCRKCGHLWSVSWGTLSQGIGCPGCAGNAKYTLDQLKDMFAISNPDIEIMSTEYKNAHGKMDYKCRICGCEWTTSANSILNVHTGCPKCAKRLPLTLEEVKNRLNEFNPDIEILSETYVNSSEPLICKCKKCGNEWGLPANGIVPKVHCLKCSSRAITLERAKELLFKVNPDIEIIDDKFNGSKSRVKCKCKKCGIVWSPRWITLMNGCICRACTKLKRIYPTGDKADAWKGGITPIKGYLRGAVLQWRKDSRSDCKYRCVITGERFDDIHHTYNFSSIMYETFDICGISIRPQVSDYTDQELLNLSIVCLHLHYEYGLGKCLTHDLHMEFHSLYTRRNNTLEQFEEFVEMKRKEGLGEIA